MRMKSTLFDSCGYAVAPVKPIVATRQRDRRNPSDSESQPGGKNRRNRQDYYLGSWISARRAGRCVKCGCDVIQGDTVKWIPASKRLLCYSCGQSEGQAVLGRGILV